MFYPNHQCRSYCLYLGSVTFEGHNYDLGVYEGKDGSVSHAIIYGEDDSDYMSGEFIFEGKPLPYSGNAIMKMNKSAYLHFKGIKEPTEYEIKSALIAWQRSFESCIKNGLKMDPHFFDVLNARYIQADKVLYGANK